ncbi:hypothetical protein [Rhizobium leguminosarum]|uniref:hypothetical protein n=1 Tax=Rhizobium leguminosarum TaxID=384 RepID=UPI0004093C71|nr:hypothetical protein [Rhizobium leguminosarum]
MILFPQRQGRGKSGGNYGEGLTLDGSRYSCSVEIAIAGFERAVEDVECTDGTKVVDRVTVKQILGALREIYFYDDRKLSLLEKTARGEELEEVDRALGGLFRGEEQISEALLKLEQAELSPHNDLSVEAWNKLRGLSGGKWHVHFAIKNFLYDPLQTTI